MPNRASLPDEMPRFRANCFPAKTTRPIAVEAMGRVRTTRDVGWLRVKRPACERTPLPYMDVGGLGEPSMRYRAKPVSVKAEPEPRSGGTEDAADWARRNPSTCLCSRSRCRASGG